MERWVGMQLFLQGPLLEICASGLMQQGELCACPAVDPWGTSTAYFWSYGETESSDVGGHQGGEKEYTWLPCPPFEGGQ